MAKVTVTIELDELSYRQKYGPGSEHWKEYMVDLDPETWEKVSKPASDYKPMEGQVLEDVIVDILHEGFYDWDKEGWLKLAIDGKAVCKGCGRVDGRPHQSYCETVAGAEQSLD